MEIWVVYPHQLLWLPLASNRLSVGICRLPKVCTESRLLEGDVLRALMIRAADFLFAEYHDAWSRICCQPHSSSPFLSVNLSGRQHKAGCTQTDSPAGASSPPNPDAAGRGNSHKALSSLGGQRVLLQSLVRLLAF